MTGSVKGRGKKDSVIGQPQFEWGPSVFDPFGNSKIA
jgi:hypothetical protein